MVASSVFDELSDVLAAIESAGGDVQHATVDQDLTDAEGGVTADLAVGVPILPDSDADDTVSIEASDAEIRDGQLLTELSVTVTPGGEGGTDRGTGDRDQRPTGTSATLREVPAYKDPDALRAVYEEYDSFPEMTEALDVDVTSETVRRHMVKYDIHDPGETTPQTYADNTTADDGPTDDGHGRSQPATEHDAGRVESEDEGGASPSSGSVDSETDTETNARETTGNEPTDPSVAGSQSSTQEGPVSQNAVTDGGNATVDDAAHTEPSPLDTKTISDVLPETASREWDGSAKAADVLDATTVAELAEAINRSRTVHEVTQYVNLNRSTATQFLREFDLIHFVSRSLGADQITVTPDEVVRRIEDAAQ